MANSVIYKRGTDKIFDIVLDCIQVGNNFFGSNIKLMGVGSKHFNVKWTDEISNPIYREEVIDEESGTTVLEVIGYDKKVSELMEAKRFNSKVVSTREDVNEVTQGRIRERYSMEDELKLQRLAVVGIIGEDWTDYIVFVADLVEKGRQFKDENFPKNS